MLVAKHTVGDLCSRCVNSTDALVQIPPKLTVVGQKLLFVLHRICIAIGDQLVVALWQSAFKYSGCSVLLQEVIVSSLAAGGQPGRSVDSYLFVGRGDISAAGNQSCVIEQTKFSGVIPYGENTFTIGDTGYRGA